MKKWSIRLISFQSIRAGVALKLQAVCPHFFPVSFSVPAPFKWILLLFGSSTWRSTDRSPDCPRTFFRHSSPMQVPWKFWGWGGGFYSENSETLTPKDVPSELPVLNHREGRPRRLIFARIIPNKARISIAYFKWRKQQQICRFKHCGVSWLCLLLKASPDEMPRPKAFGTSWDW